MKDFYDPDIYDARTTEGVPNDVAFFTELALESHAAGHPVLELACGTGRVTIPVARAGVRVVGLDASPAMLGRAGEKSAGLDNVRWVEGNMRSFRLPERFGLIFIPFRSFQHLRTVEDQLAGLACMREHLVPGGRLAIDVFNPNIPMIAEWLGAGRGAIRSRRDPFEGPDGRVTHGWETRTYRTDVQEVAAFLIDEELDERGAVTSRVYFPELTLRYLHRYEMEHLLIRAGFDIEALYGDCYRAAFADSSPEMIWLARRPA